VWLFTFYFLLTYLRRWRAAVRFIMMLADWVYNATCVACRVHLVLIDHETSSRLASDTRTDCIAANDAIISRTQSAPPVRQLTTTPVRPDRWQAVDNPGPARSIRLASRVDRADCEI